MKKDLKNDNAGISLAELIVTFALMGIFLTAVSIIISSSVLLHSELTGAMYAQSVSETLLDKITGELAAAKPIGSKAMVIGNVFEEGNAVSRGISYYDRDGRKACFVVEDGILVLEADQSWKMDDNAYMGYRIIEMQVNRLNEKNVLEVSIKIQNLKTGYEYAASRTVQSYNFKTEQDFEKIMEEDILLNVS